jgi:hypothetical protein
MAHKAKPKKAKVVEETKGSQMAKSMKKTNAIEKVKETEKTDVKQKTSEKGKTIEKQKAAQEGKTNQKLKWIHDESKDSASHSSTTTVIGLSSTTTTIEPGTHRPHQNSLSSQNSTTNLPLPIIQNHTKKANNKSTDAIGPKTVTIWKKSSGRDKSWANCRRARLSPGDLELLISSITFGWRFSKVIAPAVFVRSQGFGVNRDTEKRQKGAGRVRRSGDIEEATEYWRRWPLPSGMPFKIQRRVQVHAMGEDEFRRKSKGCGGGFCRMRIHEGGLRIKPRFNLDDIILPAQSQLGNDRKQYPLASTSEHFVILRLLRNDSHADVYLLQNSSNKSKAYVAHAFVNEGTTRNWAAFARRKMDRLRRKHAFYGETGQGGRKIIVMVDEDGREANAHKKFHIENYQQEFPALPGTGKHLFS